MAENKTKKPITMKHLLLAAGAAALVSTGLAIGITYAVVGNKTKLPSYTVTFVNNNGTVLNTQKVELGSTPKYDEIPQRENPEAYVNYTFAGWDKDTTAAILRDTTFVAQYNEQYPTCKIHYMNDDGTLFQTIEEQKRHYNNFTKPTTRPEKKIIETGKQYICSGWRYTFDPASIGDEIEATPVFDSEISNIDYQIIQDSQGKEIKAAVTGYSNPNYTDLKIKDSWGGVPVTEIAESAFEYGSSSNSSTMLITSIDLPSTITTIGKNAFKGCASLKKVNSTVEGGLVLSNSITDIGVSAFENCTSLTSISLPQNDTINVIKESCFANTGITQVTIPDNYIRIENKAFGNCHSLTKITLGKSISESTNFGCVEGCENLASIVAGGNKSFKTDSQYPGMLFNKEMTKLIRCMPKAASAAIPSTLTEIGSYAFQDCAATTIDLTQSTSLTTLNEHSFENAQFKTINLSKTQIVKIPQYCFSGCAMTSFTFSPESTTVQDYAFNNCSKLATLTINKKLSWTEIASLAFNGCDAIAKIILAEPSDLYETDDNGILYKKVGEEGSQYWELICCPPACVDPTPLKQDFTSIGGWAFNNCVNMPETFVIPDQVTKIGGYLFNGCTNLKKVTIGTGMTMEGVSSDCLKGSNIAEFNASADSTVFSSIKGVLYNKTQTMLLRCPPKYDFVTNPLSMPDTVAILADWAFKDTTIPSFKITSNLTYIGSRAFEGTTVLKYIEVEDTLNENLNISADAFPLAGPEENRLTSVWFDELSDSASMLSMINKFKTAFGRNVSLVINDSNITEIDAEAFKNSDIAGLSFGPDCTNITTINAKSFLNCVNLATLNLPVTLTTIANGSEANTGAFEQCKDLKQVTFPISCTSIGDRAFWGCKGLTSINFAKTTTAPTATIGKTAFERCSSLPSVNLSGTNIQVISHGAFANCGSIETLDLGQVEEIGQYAFAQDSSIKRVVIPKTIKTGGLANYAFDNCVGITEVIYEGNSTDWASIKVANSNPFSNTYVTKVYCQGDGKTIDVV